ncbi:MAG: methyltransferase domain-containing protein [Nocardioides sp.]
MTSPGSAPPPVEPDTKDWTWVITQACPDCGFDGPGLTRGELPDRIRENAAAWAVVLTQPGLRVRPEPEVWSALEYACHVRDVHALFDQRVRLMLAEDDPQFDNWDQDETAHEQRYDLQDPAEVGPALVAAAEAVAATYAGVADDAWERPGRRSNGSQFTVDTMGRYHLHDVVHHLWDVGFDAVQATVAAYDAAAEEYHQGTQELPVSVVEVLDRFVRLLPPGGRVLEIGSGGGRDAEAMEARGAVVRRTDITAGFVRLLHEQGYAADLLDPLTDDLADPDDPTRPYDAVWASASLLHVAREDLPIVLTRLATATRATGLLHLAVKEGDGEEWSTHGHVPLPRRFVYWRERELRQVLSGAGWDVLEVRRVPGSVSEQIWLDVVAARRAR